MRFQSGIYDIEAWIEYKDDGRRLPEHRAEQKHARELHDGYRNCEGFLEIEEGKDFSIVTHIHKPVVRKNTFGSSFQVDGRSLLGHVYRSDLRMPVEKSDMHVRENGELRVASPTFAPLEKTCEDADVDVRGAAVNDLCTIALTLEEGSCQLSNRGLSQSQSTDARVGKVHEKQLKLGSSIIATKSKPLPKSDTCNFTPKPVNSKICRFKWSYHTRDMLVIKGIIDEAPATVTASGRHAGARRKPSMMDINQQANVGAGDVSPDIGGKRKRLSAGGSADLPAHGSLDRPFKIDNEDSDDEVMLDKQKINKKIKVETIDFTRDDRTATRRSM